MVSFLAAQLRDFFGAGPPPIVCAGNRPIGDIDVIEFADQ